MLNTMIKTATAAAFAIGFAASAQAVIVVPVSAVGSSSFAGYADFNAIDTGPGSDVSDWSSNGDGASAFLDLDLGAIYNLTTAYVTDRVTSGGGNNAFSGGTTDFTTSYSLTAYTDGTFTTAIGGPLVFNKSTPGGPTTIASFLDVQSLSGFTAQYVRYSVLASNGGNTGLSDIRFDATVPEPGTWALMIIGFGLVGVSARRRVTRVAA